MAQLAIASQSRTKCYLLRESCINHVFGNYTSVRASQTPPLPNCASREVAQTRRCSVIKHPWSGWERNGEETQQLSPRTRMHLGLSSSVHFTLSFPSLSCRPAVKLLYGHLWIGSQLIYSTRKHRTCYFALPQIITAVILGGETTVAAHVPKDFGFLLKPVRTVCLLLRHDWQSLTCHRKQPANKVPNFFLKCTLCSG